MRRGVAWVLAAAVIGLGMVGTATPASAHNVLIDSSPENGAEIDTAPDRIDLVFDQIVQPGFNTVTVTGPDQNRWEETSEATVDGETVSTTVHPLGPAGEYTVGFRVLSADGHTVRGSTTFTLTEAGDGDVPPQPADDEASADGSADEASTEEGMPVWPWIAGAAVLLAVGVTVGIRFGGGDTSKG
ncbi:Copper transport protein YcnJ precursor [Actinoalloteichus hoggarensis]|uniref:Copper transport protein YcnJ n=2 Tax=Actinoalloteichus hoggarensis TaxID=1470176 RepID=A0A221VW43_9PSEU|nr:copper resistance CopC family protein [Actinoalloteichus hoggarensis]ASO17724.1 Copper transport protein YcnJ precursor [Actinoalloteichus hoggarensis]